MNGNKKIRKAISIMVLASYLVAGTILHCFHSHPVAGHSVCGHSACESDSLKNVAECCGCGHGCHEAAAKQHDLDHGIADSEPQKGHCSEHFESATGHDLHHNHCAVCRFLAQASTSLEVVELLRIVKAEPSRVVSDLGQISYEFANPWHSRAPPLFAEI